MGVQVQKDSARFVISDEGAGFDTSIASSSKEAESMHGDGGRGLMLMHTFMDEVVFNEAGNQVTMIKRASG